MYDTFRAEFPDRCVYGDAIEVNDRIVRMGHRMYRHEDCEAARTASYADAKPRAAYFTGRSVASQLRERPYDGYAAGYETGQQALRDELIEAVEDLPAQVARSWIRRADVLDLVRGNTSPNKAGA